MKKSVITFVGLLLAGLFIALLLILPHTQNETKTALENEHFKLTQSANANRESQVQLSNEKVETLRNRPKSNEPKERGSAGSSAVVKPQTPIDMIKSDDWKERDQAMKELIKMVKEEGNKTIPNKLISLIQDKETSLTALPNIINTLSSIDSKEAIPEIENLLGHENAYVRSTAAAALGDLGSAQASEALNNALNDRDRYVRQSVYRALGKLKDTTALDTLIPKLETIKDEEEKMAIVTALGDIGNSRSVEPLSKELLANPRSYEYKTEIVRSFDKIGDSQALPSLKSYLTDLEASVHQDPIIKQYWQGLIDFARETIIKIETQK